MPSGQEFLRTLRDLPRLSVAGDVYATLAGGEHTDGRYALFEALVQPGGGPPPHVHNREDESFYVLDGEITLSIHGRQHVLRPGTMHQTPRGVEHTFRNTGDGPARMLVLVTPAGLEKFFEEVGDPLPAGSTTPVPMTSALVARIVSAAPRYGLDIRAPS